MTGPGRAGDAIVGRIVGAFGLRGETKVASADPNDLQRGLRVNAHSQNGSNVPLVIGSVRGHKQRQIVRFEGIDDVSAAEALRGAVLYARRADLPPLPAGTYRDEDLIGMSVVDARLGPIGIVREVVHYPHADMLVVGERNMLVPVIAAYGVVIDEAAKAITTRLPDGFEDL